jgi:hypothetical protein
MLIPNTEAAVVDVEKLRGYCLNPFHSLGRYKAGVFSSALGLSGEDATEMANALLGAARNNNAHVGRLDRFGQRYVIDFELERAEKKATIRTAWIIETGTDFPRLTTCFVL